MISCAERQPTRAKRPALIPRVGQSMVPDAWRGSLSPVSARHIPYRRLVLGLANPQGEPMSPPIVTVTVLAAVFNGIAAVDLPDRPRLSQGPGGHEAHTHGPGCRSWACCWRPARWDCWPASPCRCWAPSPPPASSSTSSARSSPTCGSAPWQARRLGRVRRHRVGRPDREPQLPLVTSGTSDAPRSGVEEVGKLSNKCSSRTVPASVESQFKRLAGADPTSSSTRG